MEKFFMKKKDEFFVSEFNWPSIILYQQEFYQTLLKLI